MNLPQFPRDYKGKIVDLHGTDLCNLSILGE